MSCCYSNRGFRSFHVEKNAEKDEEMEEVEEVEREVEEDEEEVRTSSRLGRSSRPWLLDS